MATQPLRRPEVFRLRPLAAPAPAGLRGYVVHGDAALPTLTLRSADVLCVGERPADGGLEVLEAPSLGHPMLGHRPRGRLHNLPADMPCSDELWAPVGGVQAVWRRELSARAASGWDTLRTCAGAAPRPASLRVVAIRVPQAALALARAERPELMGRSAPLSGGGTVLAFPGSQPAAVPAPALLALAQRLTDALGPGAMLDEVSDDQVLLSVRRAVDLDAAAQLVRSLSRRVRLPLCAAVADDAARAHALVAALGPDELLFELPASGSSSPASASLSTAAVRPGLQPVTTSRERSWPWPQPAPRTLPHPATAIPRGAPRIEQPGPVQLGLFDRAVAA